MSAAQGVATCSYCGARGPLEDPGVPDHPEAARRCPRCADTLRHAAGNFRRAEQAVMWDIRDEIAHRNLLAVQAAEHRPQAHELRRGTGETPEAWHGAAS